MADEKKIAELQAEESMFVQTAQSIAGGDGMVTLRGVSPSTLYFSDRPQRVVGHMKTPTSSISGAPATIASRPTRRTPCSPSSRPAASPTTWSS